MLRPSPISLPISFLGFSLSAGFGSERLASPTVEHGESISWHTSIGNRYQLQSGPSENGPWTALGPSAIGDGSEWIHFLDDSSGHTFFQLREEIPQEAPLPLLPGNGGFENATSTAPLHWTTWATGGNPPPRQESAEAFEGNSSCHVRLVNQGASPSEAQLLTLFSEGGENILPEQTYRFFFWAKQVSAGPSYLQQYEVQWLDSQGNLISSTGLTNFTADLTWGEVSVNLTAPANAADARIGFRFVTGAVDSDGGEICLDAIGLDDGINSPTPPPPIVNETPLTSQAVCRVSWLPEEYAIYQAEASTNLLTWSPLTTALRGTTSQLEVFSPCTHPAEFFRLTSPAQTPLFNSSTVLEPDIIEETPTALITHLGDRARDRHAREANFHSYDHYLSWYWEDRTLALTITDEVAKGGDQITFDYTTQHPLSTTDFRAFFRGLNTVAEYYANLAADTVGPNQYRAILTHQQPDNRPLAIGDRIEIEISQFLDAPPNGRANYYGTTFLYIVGTGVVPWEGKGPLLDSYPLPEQAWLGGRTTLPYQYSNEPDHRFKQMAGNISPTSTQPFMLGRRLHHTNFGNGSHTEPGNPVFQEHAGKLGPAFVARSCVKCHTNNGRSLPPEPGSPLLQSRVLVGENSSGAPHSLWGDTLQPRSTSGPPEPEASIESYTILTGNYGDGTLYELRKPNYVFSSIQSPEFFSVRSAQQLIGLGLLEAISENDILALADPEDSDGDGISGRPQTVLDPTTGELRLGRFTAKASKARISHQTAFALNRDMGVTTAVAPALDGEPISENPELEPDELANLSRYVSLLGVAARRDLDSTQSLAGEQLFESLGCVKCHHPTFTTGPFHPFAELRNQNIQPYTDLLLHDLGPGLADNIAEEAASGSEWRTAPLWNIGLTAGVSGGEAYLHDGRARNLAEAILWHGGEAESAKENFRILPAADREALLTFLRSL